MKWHRHKGPTGKMCYLTETGSYLVTFNDPYYVTHHHGIRFASRLTLREAKAAAVEQEELRKKEKTKCSS